MSVAVSVGYLDEMRRCDEEGLARYRKVFKDVKAMLRTKKLPAYDEPEDLQGKGWWAQALPAVGIAYLQRLAVYLWRKKTLPAPGTQDMGNPLQDKAIEFDYEDCYFSPDHTNKK